MITLSGVYEIILIATIIVTAIMIIIHVSKRKELTSEETIKKLESHSTMFRTVFLLGISALVIFIFYEMLEIFKLDYYPSPPDELFLFIKTSMFLLVLCSFTLNIKIVTMVLGVDE